MRQINLLPESYQKVVRITALKKTLMVSVIMLSMIIVPIHLWLANGIRELNTKLTRIKLARAMPELYKVRKEVNLVRSKRDRFVNDNRVLLEISAQRVEYKSIMKYIGDIAHNKVWFDNAVISSQTRMLTMTGKAHNAQRVSEFLLELKKLPYFSSIDLTSMQSNTGIAGTTVNFSLECVIK